jgi:L-lactate dehydrogenase complex protein LldE
MNPSIFIRSKMAQFKLYLFTTCLVDQVYPQVGAAVVRLLRKVGAEVVYPEDQICCGQPFYNSGFNKEAKKLAMQNIEMLWDADAVVIPSGSCTAMIRLEYPKLFADQPGLLEKASQLANKTFELTEFLSGYQELFSSCLPNSLGEVTYHDSCHMCRSLKIREEPRVLLQTSGYQLREMDQSDRCCGFGGIFMARMPELSQAIAKQKLKRGAASGAPVVVTADPGCLMRMQLDADDQLTIKHVAQLLDEALPCR